MSLLRCLHAVLLLLGLLSTTVTVEAKAKGDAEKMANRTIERTVQLRTHSIFAPYIDQDLQNRWWDFGADAYVNTNKHVRLTRARPSQMGWLWSRLPITAANFVIEVEFKISGESTHLFGDGLALWLTKDRIQEGPIFGNADKFEGLGIFLDTYANSRHAYTFPRISAMLGDGMTGYDQENDGEANSLGACSANYRRTNVATKLRVTYVRDGYLDVKIQYKAWDDWSDCFTIPGAALPLAPFLGFSAMTGDVFDAHDIISITTYSAILSAADKPRDKLGFFGARSRASGEAKGTWFGLLVKLGLFGAVCAGGWFGWREYDARRRGFSGPFGASGRGFGVYSNSKRF